MAETVTQTAFPFPEPVLPWLASRAEAPLTDDEIIRAYVTSDGMPFEEGRQAYLWYWHCHPAMVAQAIAWEHAQVDSWPSLDEAVARFLPQGPIRPTEVVRAMHSRPRALPLEPGDEIPF